MDPFIAALAVDVTRRGACSALPHAPVLQDRGGRRRGAIRRRSATVLHRLADRLDSRTTPEFSAAQRRCST